MYLQESVVEQFQEKFTYVQKRPEGHVTAQWIESWCLAHETDARTRSFLDPEIASDSFKSKYHVS